MRTPGPLGLEGLRRADWQSGAIPREQENICPVISFNSDIMLWLIVRIFHLQQFYLKIEYSHYVTFIADNQSTALQWPCIEPTTSVSLQSPICV